MEWSVEFADHRIPCEVSFCNLVEVLLDIGCESIVEDGVEILHKIVCDDHSDILRQQSAFLCSYSLSLDRRLDDALAERKVCHRVFLTCLVTLDNISSSLGEG